LVDDDDDDDDDVCVCVYIYTVYHPAFKFHCSHKQSKFFL